MPAPLPAPWTIRSATDADSEQLGAMNRRLIQDEGHRHRMRVSELVTRMRGWLTKEYAAWLMERDKGDHMYIRQLWVEPQSRRQGLGRQLIERLADTVWAGRRLRMEVLTGDERVIAFWRAVGFAEYCLTLERQPPPRPIRPASA